MQSSIVHDPVQKCLLTSCGAPDKKYFNATDTIFPLAAHEWMEWTLPFANADRTWPWLASSDLATKNKTRRNKIMQNSFSNSDQSGKSSAGFAFILAVPLGNQ